MIDTLFAIVDAVRRQPYLLLSGLQLIVILAAIIFVLPRRWQVRIGLTAALLLATALIGRML